MSDLSVPVGLLDTVIALITGGILTLIGIIYRGLTARLDDLEADVDELEEGAEQVEQDMEVVRLWMFGNDDDATDGGLAQDIEEGFNSVENRFDELDEKVEGLVDALHDEDALEFERDHLSDD